MSTEYSISETNNMSYSQMLIKPLMSMWENIGLVLPALVISIGLTIFNALTQLIKVEAVLVVGLIILIFLDLISGVYKALREKNLVTSIGLRQTSIKFVEYTIVCMGFVVLSNMSPEMLFIKKIPFLWLGMVEIKSIIENLTDKKGVINELYKHIKELINKRQGSADS